MSTSPIFRKLGSIRAFLQCSGGSVAILTAVLLFLLIMFVGVAIDLGRKEYGRIKAFGALDAACTSAASIPGNSIPMGTRQGYANEYFAQNFAQSYITSQFSSVVMTANADQTVFNCSVNGTLAPVFVQLFGYNSLNVDATSEVTRNVGATALELALVLDNTGSMIRTEPVPPATEPIANNKINDLKTGVTTMMDILFGSNATLPEAYVSLVPFSYFVNIGTANAGWLESPPSGAWTGCVNERTVQPYNDEPPSAALFSEHVDGTINNDAGDPVPSYDACPTAAAFFMNDKAGILTKINQMTADGATRIDNGLVWGWRALSPKWRGLFGQADRPFDYGSVPKILVLMTDGENWPPAQVNPQADNNVATICTQMKDASRGIIVYTIAFDIPDTPDGQAAKALLQNCASGPDNYFDAPDGAGLIAAFVTIGNSLTSLLITR